MEALVTLDVGEPEARDDVGTISFVDVVMLLFIPCSYEQLLISCCCQVCSCCVVFSTVRRDIHVVRYMKWHEYRSIIYDDDKLNKVTEI